MNCASSVSRPPSANATAKPRPAIARQRLLIADLESELTRALRYSFEVDGHGVEFTHDAGTTLARARLLRPDVMILGQKLLDREGHSLLQQLRAEHGAVPVMILSTHREDASALPGLRLGFDEFVVRPVSVSEVRARLDMMLSRKEPPEAANPAERGDAYHFGDIEVEPASQTVRKNGVPVSLRPKEFDLLMALLRRGGRLASRVDLLQDVWGYTDDVVSRTIDSHVSELRRKLEDNPREPVHIVTVRKRGYRLQR